MAKSFQEMKREHELSLVLKLAILLISVITFFTVFLVLYLTKTSNFFFISISVFFLLFGALYIGFSAIIKDAFGYVAGAISLVAGLIVLLAGVIGVVWFVWLISAIVLATVLIVILLMAILPKLQIVAKNDDPEYKNYLQRREEEKGEEEKEELPQIKSFKED